MVDDAKEAEPALGPGAAVEEEREFVDLFDPRLDEKRPLGERDYYR